MPVPAVPRRAAPPRKKNAKSPAPPTPAVEAQSVESPEAGTPQETSDDASKLLQDAVHKSKEDEVALGLHPAEIGSGDSHHLDEPVAKTDLEQSVEQTAVGGSTEGPVAIEQPIAQPAHEETPEEPEKHDFEGRVEDSPVVHDNHVSEISAIGEAREEATAGVVAQETAEPELKSEEPEAHEAEEDETARRKRIAERLRQQGGFNPFSAPPPPVRRQSTASVESSIKSPREDAAFSPQHEFEEPALRSPASPPPPPRRQSIRKSSTDSNILTSSAGLGRRTSTDSVRSPAEEHYRGFFT
ncbi:hypothetical protein BDY19DRAFT_316551 [Irpex rosettiformis]|uniref:Uncharacterized protein n=1 Tax=Irpex rosettiformis TaxID=378272 RepID=A0ACB8TY53_9APHY|nr:hypothetical protein BDY19DRAFT_316551 [Irpex rosettiformis]